MAPRPAANSGSVAGRGTAETAALINCKLSNENSFESRSTHPKIKGSRKKFLHDIVQVCGEGSCTCYPTIRKYSIGDIVIKKNRSGVLGCAPTTQEGGTGVDKHAMGDTRIRVDGICINQVLARPTTQWGLKKSTGSNGIVCLSRGAC